MEIPQFLFEISSYAQQIDQRIWLVGGCVRDFLLEMDLVDYDLTCDKSAIRLANYLQEQGFAKIKSIHGAFGTAKITVLNSSIELDLATLRSERYEFPGALPKVIYPASRQEDLGRRDFTINALALQIKPNGETDLTDLFDGKSDLEQRVIRVLHENSYWEDPTRIIRAARFATRFQATLAHTDYEQIERALKDENLHSLIERVRGVRIGIELKRLLELPDWLGGAELLAELDGWCLCRDNLVLNLQKPEYMLSSWQSRLAWLLWNNHAVIISLFDKLGVEGKFQKQIVKVREVIYSNLFPSIKLLQDIKFLDNDFQNLLFSFVPQLFDSFSLMQKAFSLINVETLVQEGFHGAEIGIEMEKVFQENLKQISE